MPVSIGEVDSTVEVRGSSESGQGGAGDAGTVPSAEDHLRWQEVARRRAELAARTAAWRFDD
jgi:hypothetical protein